jgi:hypothetical protein
LRLGAAIHAAPLVRTALIVAVEIVVENGLHLFHRLEPGLATFDFSILSTAL